MNDISEVPVGEQALGLSLRIVDAFVVKVNIFASSIFVGCPTQRHL
jgi:hypothetical protein